MATVVLGAALIAVLLAFGLIRRLAGRLVLIVLTLVVLHVLITRQPGLLPSLYTLGDRVYDWVAQRAQVSPGN